MNVNDFAKHLVLKAHADTTRALHGLPENRIEASALWSRVGALEAEVARLNALLSPQQPSSLWQVQQAADTHIEALRTMLDNLPAAIDSILAIDALDALQT